MAEAPAHRPQGYVRGLDLKVPDKHEHDKDDQHNYDDVHYRHGVRTNTGPTNPPHSLNG